MTAPRTLALLALSLSAAMASADTMLHNVAGYTSTDDGLREFSVLVWNDDGKVVATGDESLLQVYADAARIDGQGRTVLPGLTDAHAHVASLGYLQTELDLMGVASVEDATRAIAAFAADNPQAAWIKGRSAAAKRAVSSGSWATLTLARPSWASRVSLANW